MGLFKSKKPTAAENIKHVAAVMQAANDLIKNKTMKVVGPTIYLYPELLLNKKTAEKWFKNLFIYWALTNVKQIDQVVYFKNIETHEVLGFYKEKKAVVLI